MTGNARVPVKVIPVLARNIPLKASAKRIAELNLDSKRQNNRSYIIGMDDANIHQFDYKAGKERREIKNEVCRKSYRKVNKPKRDAKILTVLESILLHKNTYGEQVEKLVEEPKRQRRIFASDEERKEAEREHNKKSNNSPRHFEWNKENYERVLENKRNRRNNNIERAREVSRNYKKRKKVAKIIGLLESIIAHKETHGEKIWKKALQEK